MKRITGLVFLILFSVWTHAQIKITGNITDGMNNEPLPGASVSIEGTNTGTISDIDGNFQLTVNSLKDILVISFIGYLTERIVIGEQTNIKVILTPDIKELDAVVVTALGIKREKKALGYAVQDVKGDDLTKTQQSNVVSTLSGKVAGVQITNSSGAIGASSLIKIRGNKSLNSNHQPLFVVDGTPIYNNTNNARNSSNANVDFGNAAMDIDPANIESISILKGPNAAALYGSRGANGVVLITTKKGNKGQKGIGVEVSSSYSVDKAYFFPNYQDKYGQGLKGSEYFYNAYVQKELAADRDPMTYNEWADETVFRWSLDGDSRGFNADESWGPRLDAGLYLDQMQGDSLPWVSNPDNIKNFFETGFSLKNNVALTAANENIASRISFSQQETKGIIPNTDQTIYSAGTNTNIKLGDKLIADISANYTHLKNDNLPSLGRNFRNPFYALNGWFGRQVDLQYVKDHYEDIVDLNGVPTAFNWMMGYPDQHANPYWVLYKNTMSRKRNRIYGNTSLTYEFLPGFKLVGKAGIDTYTENRKYIYHQYTRRDWTMFDEPKNGAFQTKTRQISETNLNLMLMVDKNISEDISIAGVLGTGYRKNYLLENTITANELVTPDIFNTDNIFDKPEASEWLGQEVTQSIYESANIGYKSFLFLDLTSRHDWSSTLLVKNLPYWYPSSSLGIIFTEIFPIPEDILTYGKVRGGYAFAGAAANQYQLQAYLNALENSFNEVNLYSLDNTIPTVDLKPEITRSFETGTELKFYHNRAGLDFTYYKSNTKNQIIYVSVAPETGFNNWYKNAGAIENKGIEIQLYGTPLENKGGVNWDISVNFTKNHNQVIQLDDGIDQLSLGSSYSNASVSINAIPGEPLGSLKGYARLRDANGNLLIDESGFPIASETLSIIGNIQPDWHMGISNSLSYKNFSLSALLKIRKGGDVVSVTKSVGQKTGILAVTAEGDIRENGMIIDGVYNEGVTDDEGNDISGQPNTTVVAAEDYWGRSRNYSELSIFDGSYIKLSELSFSYNIPSSLTQKVNIQNANLSLFARNVAILWVHESNDANIDPEVSAGASLSGMGLEESQIPAPRTIGFKLNLKF